MRFGGRAYRIEDLEILGPLGLDFAEVNFSPRGGLAHKPEEFLRAAQKWNLPCLVHAPEEGDPHDLERLAGEFLKQILCLLEACHELRAPLLTVHFWMDKRFIPEKVWHRKAEILGAMIEKASHLNVILCLETLSERPEDIDYILKTYSDLGLTLDIGHMQLLSSENKCIQFLERWPERILHVHAHDNRGGDRVEDDLHLPIGEGIIDFGSIFRSLVRIGYSRTVTLEVPHSHLESSLRKLRQILDTLRPAKECSAHLASSFSRRKVDDS